MSTPIKGNFPQGMWSSKGKDRFVPAGVNVGIGQKNPQSDLSIGNGLSGHSIVLNKAAAAELGINFQELGINKGFLNLVASNDLAIGTTLNNLVFYTTNIQRLIIGDTGYFAFQGSAGGLICGSMGQDDVPTTIAVGIVNTDYIIDGMTIQFQNQTTFQNTQEHKIDVKGHYFCIWSASLAVGVGGKDIEGAVGLNGVRQPLTAGHEVLINANQEMCISGVGVVDCAINDLLQIVVRNETDTQDIIVEHANFYCQQIAGT